MKKIVNSIIIFLAGAGITIAMMGRYMDKIIAEKEKLADKHLKMFQVMRLWVAAYQRKIYVGKYLVDSGYYNIAIYGMSFMGETLYQELVDSGVNVSYGIDRYAKPKLEDLKVYHPDETLPEVDAVIVTAVTGFDDIEAALVKKVDCPILSIEDVLLEM